MDSLGSLGHGSRPPGRDLPQARQPVRDRAAQPATRGARLQGDHQAAPERRGRRAAAGVRVRPAGRRGQEHPDADRAGEQRRQPGRQARSDAGLGSGVRRAGRRSSQGRNDPRPRPQDLAPGRGRAACAGRVLPAPRRNHRAQRAPGSCCERLPPRAFHRPLRPWAVRGAGNRRGASRRHRRCRHRPRHPRRPRGPRDRGHRRRSQRRGSATGRALGARAAHPSTACAPEEER